MGCQCAADGIGCWQPAGKAADWTGAALPFLLRLAGHQGLRIRHPALACQLGRQALRCHCLPEGGYAHMPSRDLPGTGDERTARYHYTPRTRPPSIPDRPPGALERTSAAAQERHLGDGHTTLAGWPGYISQIDRRVVKLSAQWFESMARISIFVIYFWFGLLK